MTRTDRSRVRQGHIGSDVQGDCVLDTCCIDGNYTQQHVQVVKEEDFCDVSLPQYKKNNSRK